MHNFVEEYSSLGLWTAQQSLTIGFRTWYKRLLDKVSVDRRPKQIFRATTIQTSHILFDR